MPDTVVEPTVHDLLRMNNQLLAYFLKEQMLAASRTPAVAQLITFNLLNPTSPNPTALQILPKNSKRYKVGIANYGPSDILLSEKYFDPTSILQLFNDPTVPDAILPGYNQAIPVGFLAAGSNVEVNGTVGLWGYSLGSAAATNKNAIISLMDSLFLDPQDAKPASMVDALHMSGLHVSEEPGGGVVN